MPSSAVQRLKERAQPLVRLLPGKGFERTLVGRVVEALSDDHAQILAAAVAFYALLSLVPTVAALLLVYGIVGDPATLAEQLNWLATHLAPAARDVLSRSIHNAGEERTTFGLGALGAFVVAVWIASRATNALLIAVRIAYGDSDPRKYLQNVSRNMLVTAAALIVGPVVFAIVGAAPDLLRQLGLPDLVIRPIGLTRWPTLCVLLYATMALLYRFAARTEESSTWRHVSPGALVATLSWLGVTAAFNFYATKIANFQSTYGALATIVVIMTWLLLSAYTAILGAEWNAELHAMRRDRRGPRARWPRTSKPGLAASSARHAEEESSAEPRAQK